MARSLGLLLWLVPLCAIGAGSYYGWMQYQLIRSRPEVSTGLVQAMTTGEAEKLLSAKGYLKSRNHATIGSKVPGRVQRLFIEEGMKVKKGQLLAIIDHNEVDAQLETRNAQILRAKADLEESKVDLADKKRKAARGTRLAAKGTLSTEEADQAEAAALMTTARVASLEATIKYQEAMVRETREALKDKEITAPFDGTISSKNTEVGEILNSAGSGSGGKSGIASIDDLTHMEVETDVSENMLSRIAVGQPAEISVSAVPDKRYRGKLRRIIPLSDRARGTVKVLVEILEPEDRLYPELVATVHFLPDKALKTPDTGKVQLFAPKSALFEENGRSHVWVVAANNKLRKTPVDVVVTKDDLARVESGLSAGDIVVLKPPVSLKEGETVKIAD